MILLQLMLLFGIEFPNLKISLKPKNTYKEPSS